MYFKKRGVDFLFYSFNQLLNENSQHSRQNLIIQYLEKIPKKIMVDSNDPSSLASFPFSEEASGHFPNHGLNVFIWETKVSFYLVAINSSYKVESLLEI